MNPDPPPSTPLGETVAADAAVAQAGDSHARHSAGNTHCLNCGTKLTGPFCSACGQHDFDFHRSFGHVFLEALENIFHFDGKFFRNIVTLLFRPGVLTAEFNAGKRAAQVPPFRLYIFTAFIFFLWAFSTGPTEEEIKIQPSLATGANAQWTVDGLPVTFEQARKARNDPAYAAQLKKEVAAELARRAPPKAAAPDQPAQQPHYGFTPVNKPKEEMSDFERWLEPRVRRAAQPGAREEMIRAFMGALPKMLLLCLPLFAFYTHRLFRRSGQVYLQHLIIALHFHTFIFLWAMFRDGWVFVLGPIGLGLGGLVAFGGNIWLVLYPPLMLRRLFANSWKLTLFKTLVLAFVYLLTLAVAFALTAVVVFFLM